jgi:hypothetical protein
MIGRMLVVAGVLVAASAPTAVAQFYKGKTINMIINYPAGGPSDIEGRIVAQHLPAHVAGRPSIVIKNVGGAGGVIGANQLGEAAPNGETMGFFTLDTIGYIVANPAIRVRYTDFMLIAGVANPLVVYMRRDTPPGIKVATDIMQASEFKALSLNIQSSNTVNQALMLDLLGVKNQEVPAFRALKDVETAVMQNLGQMASHRCLVGRLGRAHHVRHRPAVVAIVAPQGRRLSRSRAVPHCPPSRSSTARSVAVRNRPGSCTKPCAHKAIRSWQCSAPRHAAETSQELLLKCARPSSVPGGIPNSNARLFQRETQPILVSGEEGSGSGGGRQIKPEIKAFIADYSNRLVK